MQQNLKTDTKPIQQKRRPVPIHFRSTLRCELAKLIEKGHLEEADETTHNCSVSPAVITIKKDKSIEIALDSRKLIETFGKRKATMTNMEISLELTDFSAFKEVRRDPKAHQSMPPEW